MLDDEEFVQWSWFKNFYSESYGPIGADMAVHTALDITSNDEIKNQVIRLEHHNLYLAWKLFWNTEPETKERDEAIEIKHAIEQTLIVLDDKAYVELVGRSQLTQWMQNILAHIDDYKI